MGSTVVSIAAPAATDSIVVEHAAPTIAAVLLDLRSWSWFQTVLLGSRWELLFLVCLCSPMYIEAMHTCTGVAKHSSHTILLSPSLACYSVFLLCPIGSFVVMSKGELSGC